MTERIGIRQLRDHLTATIRRVREGETIEITHHNRRVAVLSPVPADRVERLLSSSDITHGTPLTARVRRHPVTGAATASAALEDDRAER